MKTAKTINVTLTNLTSVFTPALIALEQQLHGLKAGDQFKLSLTGPGQLLVDTSLAMYEIIMARPAGVQLHVHSHSWLKDSVVLVWLAGNTRTLRPGAWIQFQDFAKWNAERNRLQKRQETTWKEASGPAAWDSTQINYARADLLVKKYLPPHLRNRRIWAGELAEWNLINTLAAGKL